MRFTGFLLRTACVAALATLAACGSDDDRPLAQTTTGAVRGVDRGDSTAFLGIPYAAAPVGPLRWKAPAAAAAWSYERDATEFGSNCAQPASPFGTASTSEDCLYLNVYSPKTPGPHPVMVWIHGGAFYLGQSNAYNPARLVAQGNVVVTINYRLGALGFLSHAALTAEGTASGNYGLMDQQAALRWVRDNVGNFGGDKANVTIFGESAGGFSVHSHLASAGSAGLFHKAIIMSGAYALDGQVPRAAAEATGTALATAVNCAAPATAACLRGVPVASLLAAQSTAWPSGPIPTIDGVVLNASVKSKLTAGTYNKVPVIQGSTRDEWRLFVALDELGQGVLTADNYVARITSTFPYLAAQAAGLAAAVYPVTAFDNSPSLALGALGTDVLFACNSRLSAKLQKAAGQNVYTYEFNDRTAAGVFPVSFSMGAYHTSELQYLFDLDGRPPRTAAQQAVADSIVSAWSRFSHTGNPNAAAAPTAWPVLGATESVQSFDTAGTSLVPDATFSATHRCSTVWTPGV